MTHSEQNIACTKAATIHSAAQSIADTLTAGCKVTRVTLNDAMHAAFGATDAGGAWSQRDSFEMLEHATVLAISREPETIGDWTTDGIKTLTERLPTQTVRSEAQVALQQFSTPLETA